MGKVQWHCWGRRKPQHGKTEATERGCLPQRGAACHSTEGLLTCTSTTVTNTVRLPTSHVPRLFSGFTYAYSDQSKNMLYSYSDQSKNSFSDQSKNVFYSYSDQSKNLFSDQSKNVLYSYSDQSKNSFSDQSKNVLYSYSDQSKNA